jgi:hypothetical protein
LAIYAPCQLFRFLTLFFLLFQYVFGSISINQYYHKYLYFKSNICFFILKETALSLFKYLSDC